MLKESLSNKYLQIALRIIIGTIFVYSAVNKLFSQEEFAKAIYNYRLLPDGLVNFSAIILPGLEFFCGVFLVIGIFKKGSSFWVIIMLFIFLVGLISAYARGLDINCGCFSLETASSKSDILARIVEDIFMLAGALIIFFFCNKNDISDVSEIEGSNDDPGMNDVKEDTLYSDPSHTQFSTKD